MNNQQTLVLTNKKQVFFWRDRLQLVEKRKVGAKYGKCFHWKKNVLKSSHHEEQKCEISLFRQ
jgi:hypothetical protein